jgi:uncharacterized damage-inducible protein DinB
MTVDWSRLIIEQAQFHWDVHLWPRLAGLTDEEFFWEPAPNSWSVHTEPDGVVVADTAWPPPDPAPVTTIGWRINHLIDNYGRRANHYFGTTVPDTVPGTAAAGLAQLELSYRTWIDTVSALDDDEIQAPLGPKGGEFAVDAMAALIVHVAREGIHHGAEICLLRDLYRAGTH